MSKIIIDALTGNLETDPSNWRNRLALIDALLADGLDRDAAAVFAEAGELPADTASLILAARAYGYFEPAEGIKLLDEILEHDRANASAHRERAELSCRTGDLEAAERHYHTAITLAPELEDQAFATRLATARQEPPLQESVHEPGAPPAEDTPHRAIATGEDPSGVCYPEPGEFPVEPLREALERPPVRPLVDPGSVPPAPGLEYVEDPVYEDPVATRREAFIGAVKNVEIQPTPQEEPRVYDYQHPDDSIFEPVTTQDDIYVCAPVTDTGVPVATLQQSLQIKKTFVDRKVADASRTRKTLALGIAAALIVALLAVFAILVVAVPGPPAPQIVAIAAPVEKPEIEKRVVRMPEVKPPSPSKHSSSIALNAVTVDSLSNLPMETSDLADFSAVLGDTGIGAGLDFGAGRSMGAGMFFGAATRGDLAVIFDITGSMYGSVPVVVKEIKTKRFRNSQVVCVYGAQFKNVGEARIIPFVENDAVRKEMIDWAKGNQTNQRRQDDMVKALHSLKWCDSLLKRPGDGTLQSLGKAIEALLGQPLSRRPATIFVFSDFMDGVDKGYMEEVKQLVKLRKAKIVFYHPVTFKKDKAHYERFAKETGGEVKERL